MDHQQYIAEIKFSVLMWSVMGFFYLYYYTTHSRSFLKIAEENFSPQLQNTALFLAKKLTGSLLLGIIPGILYYFLIRPDFSEFGLTFSDFKTNLLLIVILTLIIFSFFFIYQKFNATGESLQAERNFSTLSVNAVGWIVYLTGYEFLFRGILLIACYHFLGFWPAIAVNIAIYSAIHMVNGKIQTIGSLIFGFVACYFTLTRGTILIPIFMHIALSIFADYFNQSQKNQIWISPNQ